jgi:murein DD-endopeptidase MepM/ murein hydrolase activator NlpD
LEKTQNLQKSNVSQIRLLDRGIEYRTKLIENYEAELKFIDQDIDRIQYEIVQNQKKLKRLQDEYSKIIRASYKNLDEENWLIFILSAQDINQSYRRLKYIKYINEYRRELYDDIRIENEILGERIDSLDYIRLNKEKALKNIDDEKDRLLGDRNQRNRVQRNLLSEEKRLKQEIRKNEEIKQRIEAEIRKLIEEEARKAREANRLNILTPAEKIIDTDFGKNKGGLPWPTEQGIVTSKFGLQNHPVLRGIQINNIGIDINTVNGSDVRAVFKGEVVKVVAILGANYTVIIKHGNYRTVYQNLVSVNVKVGDQVETKQKIGSLGPEDGDYSKLHFQLWMERNPVNPFDWLSK